MIDISDNPPDYNNNVQIKMASKITATKTAIISGIIFTLLLIQYLLIGMPQDLLLKALFIVTFIIVLFALALSLLYIILTKIHNWFDSLGVEQKKETRIKLGRVYGAWFVLFGLIIIYNDFWNHLGELDFIGPVFGIFFMAAGVVCLLMPRDYFVRYFLGEN